MIRCKVTLAGVVNKTATTHQGKDGKAFITFGMKLPLSDKNGNTKDFDVSVSAPAELGISGLICVDKRLQVVGTLYFRKKEDKLYLNLYADNVSLDYSGNDKIEGDMEFWGKTGKKDVRNIQDKKGKTFQTFSAYSKESGEQVTFIWVHFINFSVAGAEWLKPSTAFKAKGMLELKLYNDNLDLGCQVKELEEWIFNAEAGNDNAK